MATKRGAGRPPSFSVMCGGEAVRACRHTLSQRRPRPALYRQGTEAQSVPNITDTSGFLAFSIEYTSLCKRLQQGRGGREFPSRRRKGGPSKICSKPQLPQSHNNVHMTLGVPSTYFRIFPFGTHKVLIKRCHPFVHCTSDVTTRHSLSLLSCRARDSVEEPYRYDSIGVLSLFLAVLCILTRLRICAWLSLFMLCSAAANVRYSSFDGRTLFGACIAMLFAFYTVYIKSFLE